MLIDVYSYIWLSPNEGLYDVWPIDMSFTTQSYHFCYNLMILADGNCESLTEIKLREAATLYYKEV